MKLEKLILKDFLTYSDLEYDFPEVPIMVQGRNKTEDKQKSNGSGKSGLQTGIEMCITASNSRGVNDSEIVMFGKKEARAELIASCNVRKERIHISWVIKVKGSNILTLTKQPFNGDWEEVSFSNSNDGKKWILNWFAISKEDLFNYYIINKTRFKSFFNSSNREKIELINRFSDASIIDGIEKVDNTELQSKYDSLNREINMCEGKLELVKHSMDMELKRDFDKELNERSEEIDRKIKEVEKIIEQKGGLIINLDNRIQEIKGEIELLESNILDTKEQEKPINEEIGQVEELIFKKANAVKQARKLVSEFTSTNWDIERKVWEDKVYKTTNRIKENKKLVNSHEVDEKKIASKLNEIEVILSGSITCPSCRHEFVLDGDINELKDTSKKLIDINKQIVEVRKNIEKDIDKIKLELKGYEEKIGEINGRQKEENNSLESLRRALSSVEYEYNIECRKLDNLKNRLKSEIENKIYEYNNKIKDSNISIERTKYNIETTNEQIKNLQDNIKNLNAEKKGLTKGDNSEVILELKSKENSYKEQVKVKLKELNKIGDKIYNRNKWADNFKQFKMHIANQSLEFMEYHTNRFLSEICDDIVVKFDGFKVLSSGNIKEEITAKIIRNNERTFNSFSGGERGRLLFSSILANRHIINSTHPYGGLDFLSIDEVFEGIDSSGLKDFVNSVKCLGICVMIITHVTDEEVDENTLLIEKVGGVSRIVNK